MQIFRALATGEYTIEEIDAMTGPAIGRPKSATFRTMDIAGIDVLAHVARNLSERLESPEDRAIFAVPPLVETMIERGLDRREGRAGLLQEGRERRDPDARSGDDGVPAEAAGAAAVARRRAIDRGRRPSGSARCCKGEDKVGRFLRATLAPTLDYAERVAPADRARARRHRRAMRWGFGWELGPFELNGTASAARHAARRRESQPRRRPQERRREPGGPRRRRAVRSSSTRR